MKSIYGKMSVLLAVCLLLSCTLTGCKPSEKKVTSSSYYKELNKKYKKLEKENKKLKEDLEKKDEPSEDELRASDYLEKISRDRIISLEIGYADNMEGGEIVRDERVFPMATAIAKRADLTSKYTPAQIEKKYGPGYEYILYDEDNAVYEIMVYGGNYVVFTDLPSNVYYAYNASALGDAYLRYRDGYPNSRLLHRLADSSLVTDDKNCYENTVAAAVANAIRKMDRTGSSRKEADKAWLKQYLEKNEKKKSGTDDSGDSEDSDDNSDKEESGESLESRIESMIENGDPDRSVYEPEGTSYTFYHHGNTLTLTLYQEYICIEDTDEKRTWYQADAEDIKALKKLFIVSSDETASEKSEDSKGGQSHETEIEKESDVSS